MNDVIKTNIKALNDKYYLVFNFEKPIELDLTSNDSESIKQVFINILHNVIEKKFLKFEFEKNGSDIFNEVAEKYIQDLNTEIETLKTKYGKIEESK